MESSVDVREYDGRVALMRKDDIDRGYLFVTVPAVDPEEAGSAFLLEFLRVSESAENTWLYSDRADPPDYDTAAELASSSIDWYGTNYTLQWVPGDEAARLKAYFENKQSTQGVLGKLFGRVQEDLPTVLPDSGE